MNENRVLAAAVSLAMFTCFGYWSARMYSENLRSERDTTFAAQPGAYPLRGYEVSLDTGVRCTPAQTPWHPDRELLLMASTRCAACSKEQASWSRLVSSGLPSSVAVTLINVGPDDPFVGIEDELSKSHIGVRHCTVTNKVAFGMATGLTATPTTVVLDHEGRIALAWPGNLTTETRDLVRAHLVAAPAGALASAALIGPTK
jgi:hypothetical protein